VTVISLRTAEPQSTADALDERKTDLIVKARDAILDDKKAVNKAKAKRIESGEYLLDLRHLLEQHPELLGNHGSWWEFFDYWFDEFCSRSDAEKRMKIAGADDPDGALAEERRKTRERVAQHRANQESQARPAYTENVRGSDNEQNQYVRKEACEQTGLSQPKVAQLSDSVVSLNVRRALEAISALTPNERGQLATLLKERNISV
jgi:hypothetical protein